MLRGLHAHDGASDMINDRRDDDASHRISAPEWVVVDMDPKHGVHTHVTYQPYMADRPGSQVGHLLRCRSPGASESRPPGIGHVGLVNYIGYGPGVESISFAIVDQLYCNFSMHTENLKLIVQMDNQFNAFDNRPVPFPFLA